mgnify:CR=1 FL=1
MSPTPRLDRTLAGIGLVANAVALPALVAWIFSDGPLAVATLVVGLSAVLPSLVLGLIATLALLAQRVQETGVALAYLNLVGGQDELVFDGNSMVFDTQGELVAHGHDVVLVARGAHGTAIAADGPDAFYRGAPARAAARRRRPRRRRPPLPRPRPAPPSTPAAPAVCA